jgi:hypothetical protein
MSEKLRIIVEMTLSLRLLNGCTLLGKEVM